MLWFIVMTGLMVAGLAGAASAQTQFPTVKGEITIPYETESIVDWADIKISMTASPDTYTGPGQKIDHANPGCRVSGHIGVAGENLKGQHLQCVAYEDRGGLVIGLVAGGAAPTKIVVVHRGKIVVHQRIGVHQLDRTGRPVQLDGVQPKVFAGSVDERRSHSLGAAEYAITHSLVQAQGT